MFKKKNYLEYYFMNPFYGKEVSEERIKEYLEESNPSSNGWWHTLKLHWDPLFKSYFEYFKTAHADFFLGKIKEPPPMLSIRTAKACPAIMDVLTNSFLIKSPSNIIITIDPEGRFLWHSSDRSENEREVIDIVSHGEKQFRTYGDNDIFKDKLNIKFNFPIYIKSTAPFIWLPPTYHNPDSIFKVFPGALNKKWNSVNQLNLNTYINIPKNQTETYHIKKGDVMGYLWFPEKTKLKHSKKRFKDEHISQYWGPGSNRPEK